MNTLREYFIPDQEFEAARSLVRRRTGLIQNVHRMKMRVMNPLSARGKICTSGGYWTQRFKIWINQIKLDEPNDAYLLQSHLDKIAYIQARRIRPGRRTCPRNYILHQAKFNTERREKPGFSPVKRRRWASQFNLVPRARSRHFSSSNPNRHGQDSLTNSHKTSHLYGVARVRIRY